MGQLLYVLTFHFKWSEQIYDTVLGPGVAFTNYHAELHSLRIDDQERYTRYKNRLADIGEEKKRKSNEAQDRYRKKSKVRLNTRFRSILSDDETEEEREHINKSTTR